MMRHLLMFSYYFPPHGGGGVLRPLQTARLLAENGWRTTVVAGPESGWWLRDESLLEGLPKEVEIVRTRALSGPGLLRLFSRNRPRQPGRGTTGRSERAIRLFRYLADWSGVPDVYCGWIPFAARAGKKIASSVDCVLSTSPVESAHLAARLVAQACNKPWIADFRDPWVRGIYRRYPTALHRRFQERLEQMVVRDAGAVIVNTGAALEDFHYRYPDLPPEKFVAIPNGYDPQEFKKQKAERVVEPGPLKMIHAGGLSLDRDPCTVFKALAELKKESTGENAPLPPQLELVGLVDEKFRSRAETLGVDDLVTFTGPV
ncbi:MAG: glycosyltransferase, partial [Gemmatimonadota bacterium]|nr:glycosyltransferase [Gemmatimonadota bacterium]